SFFLLSSYFLFLPSSFFLLPTDIGLTSVTSRTLLVAELPSSDGHRTDDVGPKARGGQQNMTLD
ncbi:hypothetical protein, partial [Microcoleus sp. LEGE 07076]|uniref:hypothetical protein n=1 Tax=Microcoleus sp. LEGE 07076 TaxID=915322 RepID=UPI001D13F1B9